MHQANGLGVTTSVSVVPTIEQRRDGSIRGFLATAGARPATPEIATAALAAVPVVALGLTEGGFFPRPWGWATLGLALASAVLFLRRDASLSRSPVVLLGLLGALGLWMAASLAWTRSPGLSVLELQRVLLYLAAVATAAALVRRHTAQALVGGVFLGTAALSIGGLVEYLVTRERAPDVLQGAYLHGPLGYANGMAVTSVIAVVLAMGIATAATSRRTRVAVAATLVPLVSALALTGSRAAALALVAGVAAVLALESERRRLLAVWRWILVVPAVAVLACSAFTPTDSGIVGGPGNELGNRVLVLLVALTALAVPPALYAAQGGAPPGRGRLRGWQASLGVVALACLVGLGIARFPDLGGDRPVFWRVALEEFGDRPLLGSGAGTYAQVWLERRPVDVPVRDAHSIVVEALAELGLVGAALVCVLLCLPLVWARRSRTRPLVPAAGGAFAAYAVHASADWDWEMPAITLAGLFCAVAIGAGADTGRAPVRLAPRARRAAVAVSALAAVVALAGLLGATALENARRSLARGDAAAAAHDARRSTHWQPWSIEGLLVEGQARLALGDRHAAGVLFARAAAREPADYRAWLAMAAVSRPDVAQAAARRARALNPLAVRDVSRLPADLVIPNPGERRQKEER
jgi:O-antigen ligase